MSSRSEIADDLHGFVLDAAGGAGVHRLHCLEAAGWTLGILRRGELLVLRPGAGGAGHVDLPKPGIAGAAQHPDLLLFDLGRHRRPIPTKRASYGMFTLWLFRVDRHYLVAGHP